MIKYKCRTCHYMTPPPVCDAKTNPVTETTGAMEYITCHHQEQKVLFFSLKRETFCWLSWNIFFFSMAILFRARPLFVRGTFAYCSSSSPFSYISVIILAESWCQRFRGTSSGFYLTTKQSQHRHTDDNSIILQSCSPTFGEYLLPTF